MPAALPKVCLSSVSPTSEERAIALAAFGSSARNVRAVGTCMVQWLDSNPAVGDNYQAKNRKGEERRELMVKFNTLRQRARPNYCIPRRIASVSRERIEEVFTWNNEIMDKVIGAQRAQALRDSGMIDWKPCAITGSTEEHMKV